jgi:enoyl-CoA hydratase
MADLLDYTLDGHTAILRMDDGKANALSDAMIDGLTAALERAEREARAVVLTGRTERFCAGFDLKVMMSGPAAATALVRRGGDLLLRLYGLPMPLIVACTGHAVAGGALVVLTGDYRIGAAGAFRIGLNEVAIGLPVPVLATELARDRLAPAALSRATLLAQLYAPDEALAAGFLDEVVPAESLLPRALAEAARLGAYAPGAFHGTKRRLRGRTIAYIASTMDDDLRTFAPGP